MAYNCRRRCPKQLAERTTSSDTADKQCSNAFKEPVQIRYFLNYEYAKHACNLLSTKPYTFRGLRNSPEPCHSQFHETLHNVPKTAAVHHSMNNFFTAEKEDTDVSALATEPNRDMPNTSNKSALPFLAISRKKYSCFTFFQRQAKLIDKCLNVFSTAACIEGDGVMIPEASTTANPKQQEFTLITQRLLIVVIVHHSSV